MARKLGLNASKEIDDHALDSILNKLYKYGYLYFAGIDLFLDRIIINGHFI